MTARIDALTLTTAGVSIAGLVFGVVAGVSAVEEAPGPSSIASASRPLSDLEQHQEQAHKDAVLADIGFGVALVMGLTTGYLYLARARPASPAVPAPARLSLALSPGGGSVLLKGSF